MPLTLLLRIPMSSIYSFFYIPFFCSFWIITSASLLSLLSIFAVPCIVAYTSTFSPPHFQHLTSNLSVFAMAFAPFVYIKTGRGSFHYPFCWLLFIFFYINCTKTECWNLW